MNFDKMHKLGNDKYPEVMPTVQRMIESHFDRLVVPTNEAETESALKKRRAKNR